MQHFFLLQYQLSWSSENLKFCNKQPNKKKKKEQMERGKVDPGTQNTRCWTPG